MSKKKATATATAEAPARADLPEPTPQEQAATAMKIDAELRVAPEEQASPEASPELRVFTPDPDAIRTLAMVEQRQLIVGALLREAETGRAGLGDSAQLRQVAAWVERGCR